MKGELAIDVESAGSTYIPRPSRSVRRRPPWRILFLGILAIFALGTHMQLIYGGRQRVVKLPPDAEIIRARCENLKIPPGPPRTFHFRTSSDRFVPGTKATLVKNATIWTGNVDGKEVVKGDVLLDKGLIKAVGSGIDTTDLGEVVTIDAEGGWVTPGIVDLHSHLGVDSVPKLSGANDGNSRKGIAQPWLRSLDGLNTRDDAYRLSISGGVTTALVLPGSANDIGGQAFTMKLRPTKERTPTSMLLEPPFTLNSTDKIDMTIPPRWRQMKHACGENPRRVYGNSRMDNIWAFREIYDKARQIKEQQDAYCSRALSNDWDNLGSFPEELQYEAIVDILRGRVKVQVHCYETVDLDDIVRLTNEFKFPIAAFHHAHETYLAPDLLKQAYGNTPASAMFATNARYKRESYRGSEFAARILADNGLSVVMKSDHPVLNSRYLLYEAQQAHYYGLPDNLAIASVTSTPARVMGMSHRIGFIKQGYDADVVLWDSHPLVLGATPRQVFIDGIAHFDDTYAPPELKSEGFQKSPETPGFDKEAEETLKFDGLPPLEPEKSIAGVVVFTNITSMTVPTSQGRYPILRTFESGVDTQRGVLVSRAGKVDCAGTWNECSRFLDDRDAVEINLKGGAISPGLISFGSALGLEEIQGEVSTKDGTVFDPLDKDSPSILGGSPLIHAADGLQFATRNAYLAYRAGVTIGVTSPLQNGVLSGLSTAFSLGTAHKLEKGALLQEAAAVHVTVGHSVGTGSVSTQIAALRRLLLEPGSSEAGKWFKAVADGKATLVVNAESADIIATLLNLKEEVEESTGDRLKLTIAGASEAHLLASEIAKADVGVIVAPSRPFPETWEKRRILPGPPITKDSAISLLLAHNVTVGIGIEEPWSARNTRFDVAWAALEAPSEISRTQALALASTNLEKLLGLDINNNNNSDDHDMDADLVATESGDLFDFEGKVVGVINPRKGVVDLF